MRVFTTILFLLLSWGVLTSQEVPPRYKLALGDRYFLEQQLSQETRTEDGNLAGNVSLDISSTLEIEVDSVTPGDSYLLTCRYTSLELNFFAPQADIAISSSNSAFIPIKSYLNKLEGTTFGVRMSATGAFLEIRGLDSVINHLTPSGTPEVQQKKQAEKVEGKVGNSPEPDEKGQPGKAVRRPEPDEKGQPGKAVRSPEPDEKGYAGKTLSSPEPYEKGQPGKAGSSPEPDEKGHAGEAMQVRVQEKDGQDELIKKTIQDAFGAAALRNAASIALEFYDDTSTFKCVKENEVLFNGRPVKITNNFYYRTLDETARRVQGVGVIAESTATIELNDYLLVTSLKGSQTYDFLCSLPSGWIMEGMSKQKIQSLSGVRDHDELPDGLKIPSVTESEYRFRGGKIN